MRLSIISRVILVVNMAIIAIAFIVGWIGVEIAGNTIEQRLTVDMTQNAARMMAQLKLKPHDGVMEHLSGIFGADVAAVVPGDKTLLGSSLSEDVRRSCAEQLSKNPDSRTITLNDRSYRIGSCEIPFEENTDRIRLYLLVPEEQIQEARDRVKQNIFHATIPVVAVAILLSILLALTVTFPIRKLARRADELSDEISKSGTATISGQFTPRRGPGEVIRLGNSLDHLLDSLRQAEKELMRSEQMAAVGRVAASAAHELRNPLSGIKMNVRILAEKMSEFEGSGEMMNLISREIDRMDIYLQELMSLAKPGSGTGDESSSPMNASAVRLQEVVDDTSRLMEGRCRHAGITIEKDYAPGIERVSADAQQIRQVVMNLMINAIEATGDGGTIRLILRPSKDGCVEFAVADEGSGVHSLKGQDIFDPFVTTRPDGAGLGLHICRKIIDAHGGTIGYKNTGTGAEFHFTLRSEES